MLKLMIAILLIGHMGYSTPWTFGLMGAAVLFSFLDGLAQRW
jgi:hypothetical protein